MIGRVKDNLLVLRLNEYDEVEEIPHGGGSHVTKDFALELEAEIERLKQEIKDEEDHCERRVGIARESTASAVEAISALYKTAPLTQAQRDELNDYVVHYLQRGVCGVWHDLATGIAALMKHCDSQCKDLAALHAVAAQMALRIESAKSLRERHWWDATKDIETLATYAALLTDNLPPDSESCEHIAKIVEARKERDDWRSDAERLAKSLMNCHPTGRRDCVLVEKRQQALAAHDALVKKDAK